MTQRQPTDWRRATVSEVGEVKGGKRLPPGFELQEQPTPHPYIRVRDLRVGGVNTRGLLFVPANAASRIRRYRIFKEDVFISVAGTLGIVGTIPESLDGANLTENADRITSLTCDRDFLMYALMSTSVQSEIESIKTVGAQPKLALGRIASFSLSLPPLPEQRAIAAALSDVDDLLQSLDRLVAKKRDVKQGAMQQLLTGTTRLPGFERAWLHKQLGDIVEIQKGQLITAADISPGSIPVVAGGRQPAYYHRKANRYGTTITISASGASAGFVNRFVVPIWASDCSTISESSEYCIEFIYQLLLLRQAEIYEAQTGGAQPHIHPRDLMPLRISLPSRDEQRAIAAILSDMDAEIDVLEVRRDKVAAIKQGMMQELLTGRTRLPISEEAIDA